ncbi:hypothetical protein [Arthrobacter sp. PAMC 25486]|uniref:hypothetical protein n=1 Tax=Arthrobacter sp. PAMC 25486 TaxID=1494608 RepID=UPI0012FE9F7A|nr:hypothetical protein [Arthrobacter sp. PAMC 25486]
MSDKASQRQESGNGNNSMQFQAGGDTDGVVVGPGGRFDGVQVAGDVSGSITVNTVNAAGKPTQEISIKSQRRFPAPASVIGIVSGLITIGGALTGYFSVKDFLAGRQVANVDKLVGAVPVAYWWMFGAMLLIGVGICGFVFLSFLLRHVLWLPRWEAFRARAGIRGENGRTYPFSIRLAARCVVCQVKMRFFNMPTKWNDHYEGRKRTGRTVTERRPVAQCKRNAEHWVEIDIARNDFDQPLPR